MSDAEYESDSDESSSEEECESWISLFASTHGHNLLCEVEAPYIEDQFNIYGLKSLIADGCYQSALDNILDKKEWDTDPHIVEASHILYGLCHARYIVTVAGLARMYDKVKRGQYGRCPRALCCEMLLMPVGMSDEPGVEQMKLFCPMCQEIYTCNAIHRNIDGAYFGTSFPMMLLLTYPDILKNATMVDKFPLRVFGFKVHPSALAAYPVDDSVRSSSSSSSGSGGTSNARGLEIMETARAAALARNWAPKDFRPLFGELEFTEGGLEVPSTQQQVPLNANASTIGSNMEYYNNNNNTGDGISRLSKDSHMGNGGGDGRDDKVSQPFKKAKKA